MRWAALMIPAWVTIAHAGQGPAPRPPGPVGPQSDWLAVGPRFDAYPTVRDNEGTPDEKLRWGYALGIGAAYLFDMPPAFPFFWGIGLDARALTYEWRDFGGVAITGNAKLTIGHAPPATFQLDLGAVVSGEDSGALVGGGVYISMLYVELGYSYQRELAIDDVPWLGRHMITIRGFIPVLR